MPQYGDFALGVADSGMREGWGFGVKGRLILA